MPNTSATQASIRQLVFAYLSMFILLLLLLISAQTIIQIALAQETHVRNVAAMIERQELRTQRMLYNVVILQSPGTAPGTTYKSLTDAVQKDETAWEQVQEAMYNGDSQVDIFSSDFSPLATTTIKNERAGYIHMRDAYRRVLAAEQSGKATIESVRPDINLIYLDETPYLQSLITVYEDVTKQADNYVRSIRVVELVIFVLSVVVITCEALFVARPAVKHFKQTIQLLTKTLHMDAK